MCGRSGAWHGMRKLTRYFALPAADRGLLGVASWKLLLAWGGLRLLSVPRLLATLKSRSADGPGVTLIEARHIGWAVEIAARNLPLSLSCLPQALATCWMLQAQGAAPRLFYGIRNPNPPGFEAHAWVELDGQPVIGHRGAAGFTILAVFPEAGRP